MKRTRSSKLSPFVRLPRGIAPLGYRNFALFWLGLAISNSGRFMELTGVVWLASELTDSAALLGLLGVARAIPNIVLGPIAGVIVDRVDQRRLLFTTQAISLGASLALGLGVAFGVVELWHLYAQVTVQAIVEAFDASVRQAMFPRLVPRDYRSEAVTLTTAAGRTAKLIGPAVGGVAIATFGTASPFLINAASFLALMAAVVMIRGVNARTATEGSSVRSELTEGARFILRTPVISGLIKLEGAFALFNMNAVMITIIGRRLLGVGPEGLGGLISAPALGALVGLTYLIVAGHTTRKGRFVILCTVAYAGGLVAFATSREYLLSFAALAVIGLFDVLVTITRQSVIQLTTPGRMRGRVIGTTRMVTGGLNQLAQTQSGILSDLIGGPLAVMTAAAVLILSAALSATTNTALWRFTSDGSVSGRTPQPTPPDVPSG